MNTPVSQQNRRFARFITALASQPLLTLLLALVFITSLSLFWPVLTWFVLKMSLANGWLHILAFGGLCGIGLYRLSKLAALPLHAPCFEHWPTLLWLGAGLAYLLNEAQIGFNTLSAVLFILFIYGLSGYVISQRLWRKLFVPTSLLILVLPFEHYLDVYLGFPLRLLSAQWAASVLQHTGLSLLTTESILMIDNRAAIVDLDCSGIKSLWIGLIFYLLLTWIEHYQIGRRWLVVGLSYLLLLILANVARITILVVLELVLEMPAVAGLLHQTLGLLGFGIASAIIWWLAPYFVATTAQSQPPESTNNKASIRHAQLIAATTLCLITSMNLLYQPQAITAQSQSAHTLVLPKQYALTSTQLNAQEKQFFTSNQSQANKYQLTLDIEGKPVKVAMVLVWSRAWKTHHVPENCYLSQGFSIEAQGVWQLPQHAMRYLKLRQVKTEVTSGAPRTAAYWFQSSAGSTPDYSARVMDNLFHPGNNWVMVSLLFAQPVTPQQISPFIQTLKQAIGDQFHEN